MGSPGAPLGSHVGRLYGRDTRPLRVGATISVSVSSHAAMRPTATSKDSPVETLTTQMESPSWCAMLLPSGDRHAMSAPRSVEPEVGPARGTVVAA